LGLGRPGEEMELEEILEEAPRLEELKIEEEVEEGGEDTEKRAVEHVQVEKTFKIGNHEVEEQLIEGEELSYLKCVKCGFSIRLDEAAKLSEVECVSREVIEGAPTSKAEPRTCGYCGREAVGIYPVEYVDNTPVEIPLCEQCIGKVEEFYLKARPNIMGASRKARIVCRHPLEGLRAVAWNNHLSTWFVRDESGKWPCPRCGALFSRLLDVTKHFIEKHPELPTIRDREYVVGVGEAFRTWQGLYCPLCGLLCESEEDLKNHYRGHGGG